MESRRKIKTTLFVSPKKFRVLLPGVEALSSEAREKRQVFNVKTLALDACHKQFISFPTSLSTALAGISTHAPPTPRPTPRPHASYVFQHAYALPHTLLALH